MRRAAAKVDVRYWREALVFSVLALISLGFLMAATIDGPARGFWPALTTRAARVLVGLVAFGLAYRLRLEKVREVLLPVYVTAVFLCLVPRLLGDHTNGAYRWINIGSLSFQPVELLKFLAVFATAEMLERRRALLGSFVHGLLPVIAVPGAGALVLITQPDIGHAFFVLATCGILILCGGIRAVHGWALFGAACLALWLVIGGFGHTASRLGEFTSGQPGFQLGRSLMAFAEGGVFGTGLGLGWIKMGYLPEARNDFVLAILGNELGLVGTGLTVALFVLFFVAAVRITASAASTWQFLVALGLGLALVLQAAINILGVTFAMPEKGIDLPFLSSGGTNLVFALASVGILLNIARAGAEAGRAEALDA